MRLIPLGVGDAWSARWYSTSLLVEAGGTRLLVDCPHPIRKMLAEHGHGVDVGDLDAVLITHLHGDHVCGLEGLTWFTRFVLGRRVKLVAHPAVLRRVWDHRLSSGMDVLRQPPDWAPHAVAFEDLFEPIPLRTDRPLRLGALELEARLTRHHVPTTALRLSHGGATIAYSCDTAFDEDLIAWLARDAALVVHETNLGGAHTPYEALVGLPEPLRRHMRLVHYPDGFDVEGSALPCLRQGEVIEVQGVGVRARPPADRLP